MGVVCFQWNRYKWVVCSIRDVLVLCSLADRGRE